ncbi:MAG: roadblock/LC7 domain-containing protein [Candidatus Marinimicrobia bacterium]|nr:roadblock/LC7 domain-containing protein [Candidatus Neomarinimicrobiota bacterium]
MITAYLGAEGCLLASQDGMVLACANMEAERAARQAAFAPQFFRRTNHFLNRLGAGQTATLVLPTKDQTLILMAPGSIYLLATLAPAGSVDAACQRSRRLCAELAWQLGARAVVRKRETYDRVVP